MPVAQHTQVLF